MKKAEIKRQIATLAAAFGSPLTASELESRTRWAEQELARLDVVKNGDPWDVKSDADGNAVLSFE